MPDTMRELRFVRQRGRGVERDLIVFGLAVIGVVAVRVLLAAPPQSVDELARAVPLWARSAVLEDARDAGDIRDARLLATWRSSRNAVVLWVGRTRTSQATNFVSLAYIRATRFGWALRASSPKPLKTITDEVALTGFGLQTAQSRFRSVLAYWIIGWFPDCSDDCTLVVETSGTPRLTRSIPGSGLLFDRLRLRVTSDAKRLTTLEGSRVTWIRVLRDNEPLAALCIQCRQG